MDSSPVVEARRVSRYYRQGTPAEVRAVDDVSLRVERGSFVVLSGPSGSGKTTLLALLGALERPTCGEIRFAGRDLSRLADAELARVRRNIGFVFQDFALIPRLPIWQNITYGLIPRGIARQERLNQARFLLTRFGLESKLRAHPEELSGGEQQRVAVVRALIGQPQILLADEPTSNLDPAAGAQVLAHFQEIHAAGTTIVVATHDPEWATLKTDLYQMGAGHLTLFEFGKGSSSGTGNE
jgi:putative ABC transport system ATP-binding protein